MRTALLLPVLGAAHLLLPGFGSGAEPHKLGSEKDAAEWANRTAARMPLEKKCAQLVFVDVAGGYLADEDPRLLRWIELVRHAGVGGVVVYGGTPRDVAALLNRLQREAEIPLLAASDFEGGPGQQMSGATEFPANMAFAAAGSEELVRRAAAAGAAEGRSVGIGLTYSPAVDYSIDPENPAESVRSFGSDVSLLRRMVKAYVEGYMENGMLTSAKHFPGRGSVERWPADPEFSTIRKSAARLEAEDLAAFKAAVDAGVPFVMSEHIIVPALTGGSDLPASVERKLATGWLRDKLGFRGLLTTDDLWYDHVTRRFGPAQVGVKALQAGHDLLLKPKDPAATIQAVVDAVRKGELSEDHIDQAVRKLLFWKARLRLHESRLVDAANVGTAVGGPRHQALAQEVADRSLTVLKNDGVFPLPRGATEKLLNISIQKLEIDPSPEALALKLAVEFPGMTSYTLRPDTDAAVYRKALESAKSASLVTISLFVQRDKMGEAAPLRAADRDLIERVTASGRPRVVVMSYGNPHLIRRIGGVPAFIVGYGERGWFGNQPIYFDSFVRLLKGELRPQGRLPVIVSEKYPVGAGLRW